MDLPGSAAGAGSTPADLVPTEPGRQQMVGVSRKSTFASLGLVNQRGGNHVISTSCNTHSNAVPAARRAPELAGRTGRPRLLVREVRASLEPAAGPRPHRPKHQVARHAGR